MSSEDDREILRLLREARAKRRGYADFFSWPLDRDLEEIGIVQSLQESLTLSKRDFFDGLIGRGRGKDPPDCEACDYQGQRVAIEVTELVDPEAIRLFKKGNAFDFADWPEEKFVSLLGKLLLEKNSKHPILKDPPYPGGYVVVVHTDEAMLTADVVTPYLRYKTFSGLNHIDRAFLLLSYSPQVESPSFELKLSV